MSIDSTSNDALALRKLTPLSTLSSAHFEAICAESSVDTGKAGSVLFRRGDTVKDLVYLLEGDVSLQCPEFRIEVISAAEEAVRFPLAHQIPRKIDAVALTPVRFIRVKAESIHAPPEVFYKYEEEESGYMVSSETDENSDDWMSAMLYSPVYQKIPPAKLQKLLMSFATVEFKPGEAIINQGDAGDYYYFIKQGFCHVLRKPTPDSKDLKIGQLRQFDSFGEDALITGRLRDATVVAATPVVVMRTDKEKFNSLIKELVISYMDLAACQQEVQQASAVLFDVREPDAYNALHVAGSQNLPFFSIRMQLKTLKPESKYVFICQDGKLSEAAAFLMAKYGFNAAVLRGGIDKLPPDALIGQKAQAAATETAAEILSATPQAETSAPSVTESPESQPPAAPSSAPAPEVAATAPAAESPVTPEAPPAAASGSPVAPPAPPNATATTDTAALQAENEELKATLERVKRQYQALYADRQKMEKNFRLVLAQNEKLKEMLKAQGGQLPPSDTPPPA